MLEWWNERSLHSILFGILVFQGVNLCHHWIVIYLKLRIYRITVAYLKAAEEEQIQTATTVGELNDATQIIKDWAELARIQTSRVGEMGKQVRDQVKTNADLLSTKIDEVPDKVADKIGVDGSSSGSFRKTENGT